jgi:excinuclease UvrABC nuclease subunit
LENAVDRGARDRQMTESILDGLPGVGPKR